MDPRRHARRTLAHRWPDAEAIVVGNALVDGILDEARKCRAEMIVMGWRGHGASRRLLMGSVSRGVVRGANCAVLVVRGRILAPVRNVVLAFDGSPTALRAVSLVARCSPARDGRVTVVGVAELMLPTSGGPKVGGIRASRIGPLTAVRQEWPSSPGS